MGLLVPAEFPLGLLKNDAERLVVEALCSQLTDGWLIIPAVALTGQRDREIDVVIVHEREGIAVIEVKGHRPRIRDGIWYADGVAMQPQPLDQARDNAYDLRTRIRSRHPSLQRIGMEYAVAFPNTGEVSGQLPPGVDATQVLTCRQLEDCRGAIDALMTCRFGHHQLGQVGVDAVLSLLRPNADISVEPEARARLARRRLDEISADQVRALESLDMNRRVCVTGGAGSGKTRLACAWARRAMQRDERTLLTCFNKPLSEMLAERIEPSDALTIGSFHDVAQALEGMASIEVPDGADGAWWDSDMLAHLQRHWAAVTERFDTIIIDEAQDFSPVWIDMLAELLDPDGPRRLLLLADLTQYVFARGFEPPDPDTGWTRCELANNCRNSSQIASMLRTQFGGGLAPIGGPESEDVDWIEASDVDDAVEAVGDVIDRILDDRDHSPADILVATISSSVRDRLRHDYAFVAWEDRSDVDVLCENVHRVKGLEYDHVVLVVHRDDVSDELLYVGASRAVMSLTVVAPTAVAQRFGLDQRRPAPS